MFASDSVSLPRLDNPTGACPAHRRQWADFLVSLMAPLHRQYKTARTETRRHLLLKIRQMPTQTSASRGYVLFRGANKGHTRKSYKLSPGCGHDPRSAPNLERHGSSKMQPFGWLEMPYFLNRIFHLYFHMKSPSVFPVILLIKPKHGMLRATPPLFLSLYNVFLLCVIHLRRQTLG